MSNALFVSRFRGRTWAIAVEGGRVAEIRVDAGGGTAVGRIVKGRVTKVLAGMQVAFVDVGTGRDAFLHVDEVWLPEEGRSADLGVGNAADDDDASEARGGDGDGDVRRRAPIQDRLSTGRELVVQITRDPVRAKGPRATCHVSLPGRFVVHLPNSSHRGVSRRITDRDERQRLRDVLSNVDAEGGFIARTAAQGASPDDVRSDAERLAELWQDIARIAEGSPAPRILHDDGDIVLRALREAPEAGFDRIVVDDERRRELAERHLRHAGVPTDLEVEVHVGTKSVIEANGLDVELDRAFRPQVRLPSGGSLVIEPTEALVSIDVNTGRFVGKGRPEETVFRTNLEAAEEIPRQLRLRDLGGIVVVDFIDMSRGEHRSRVLDTLRGALRHDRARTRVVGISELGLVQISRKRSRAGAYAAVTRPCPACEGRGRVFAPDDVAGRALEEVRHVVERLAPERITVRARPEVIEAIERAWLRDVEWESEGPDVTLEPDATLGPEAFDLTARGSA